MRRHIIPRQSTEGAESSRGKVSSVRLRRGATAAVVIMLGAVTAVIAMRPALAADNPYQRGPDPTTASVAATYGSFATAQINVSPGNGFNGGVIYYPTDTSQTYGGIAIVPGYTALFANEEAWMGPRLASFGFVVIGIETNSRNDYDTARGTQLLAALDYLTRTSSVRTRVDPARLSVIGHSMGGGGAVVAAINRPSLKAAVALAPYVPSGNMSNVRVPTIVIAGQNDTVVTPSYLDGLYPTLPASTPSAFVQIAGVDHLFATKPNTVEMRTLIPWLKIFVDSDTRYNQFLCPTLKDMSGVSRYSAKCSLLPTAGPTSSPTPTRPSTPPTSSRPSTPPTSTVPTSTVPTSTVPTSTVPTSTVPTSTQPSTPPTSAGPSSTPGACSATYRTVGTWPGGWQGEVTVTAGSSAINGWTVRWTLSSGQTISQLWSGTLSTSGSAVTVKNANYNGSLQASASTTFGFLGGGTPSSPSLTCTSP